MIIKDGNKPCANSLKKYLVSVQKKTHETDAYPYFSYGHHITISDQTLDQEMRDLVNSLGRRALINWAKASGISFKWYHFNSTIRQKIIAGLDKTPLFNNPWGGL